MLPFRRILWPTDFSEPSYVALKNAVELSTHFGARLELVHIVDMLPTVISDMGLGFVDLKIARQVAVRDASYKLQQIVKERVPAHVQTVTSVREGYIPEQIRVAATEAASDLIVIASNGLKGWRHLVFGSVVEKVVQIAPCAVLVVHRPLDDDRKPTSETSFSPSKQHKATATTAN